MPPDWLLPGPFPEPFDTDERCTITELLNDSACPEVSLALAVVAPGVTTRLHMLAGIIERYVMLTGTGRAEVGGVGTDVRPGDRVLIPACVSQRITNTGREPLEFHCICTPRFRQDAYADLDEA